MNGSAAPTASTSGLAQATGAVSSSTHETIGISDDGGDDDDDDIGTSDESVNYDDDMMAEDDELTARLAIAGPTGAAAAAAISSTRKRKRCHAFETNPSIRKRQQTRLLRKLKQNIEEYSLRVGQQAVVIVATPGKSPNSFRAFGAKPLEDVMRGMAAVVMAELENALARQPVLAKSPDPSRHDLPPLVVDGIPTPVEKMTQAQLRGFIPLMLKYSTGRGKPGWGKESTRPMWWPKGVPWANVRMDARIDDDKNKISWTHALRQIVINCYKYHGREDLLPVFAEDEEATHAEDKKHIVRPQVTVSHMTTASGGSTHYAPTVVQTISNPDGTVSIIQVDTGSGQLITLPDGTTAHVQNLAHLEATQPGVHTLAEVATAAAAAGGPLELSNGTTTAELTPEGHIILTSEDGQTFPISVGGMITVPVPANMYQAVVANMSHGTVSSDGTVQFITAPMTTASSSSMQASRIKTEHGIVTTGGALSITPITSMAGGTVLQLVSASEVSSSSSTSTSGPGRRPPVTAIKSTVSTATRSTAKTD